MFCSRSLRQRAQQVQTDVEPIPTGLEALANDRRRRRGPLPWSDLNLAQKRDFYSKATAVALERLELSFMDCARVVAIEYDLRLHTKDHDAIKKALSRSASEARVLKSLVDLSEDIDPNKQNLPQGKQELQDSQKPSTARGKGRQRCGRKRKSGMESAADLHKRPYHGAGSHHDFQEAVKAASAVHALKVLNKEQTLNKSAKQMSADLAEQQVTLSTKQCTRYINTAINNNGTAISPQRRGGVYVPSTLEKAIAGSVKWFRDRKMPVFPDEVKEWANAEIKGTPFEQNFPDGKVTEGWYRGFLKRQGLLTGNLRPLEMARHQWFTEANLITYYDIAGGVLVNAGVAHVNPDYDPNAPFSMEYIIDHPQRIASFDETRVEMDCTKGGKGNREKVIRNGIDDDGEGVVTKSDACATACCGRLGDNRALPPMIVFNSGESLDANWCPGHSTPDILDKDGNPLKWIYQCNDKGSMNEAMNLHYVKNILWPALGYPKPRATHPGQQAVVICDGVGSHITLPVLELFAELGIEVILRVPNLSCRLQGEDLISFLLLKGDFRVEKTKKFVAINKGRLQQEEQELPAPLLALGHQHLVECFFKPWHNAFQPDKNEMGWKLEGVVPFTKTVLWKYRETHKTSEWTIASNHVSTRASRISSGSSGDDRRESTAGTAARNVATLAGKIPAEVQVVVQQAPHLPALTDVMDASKSKDDIVSDLTAQLIRAREMLATTTDYIAKAQEAQGEGSQRAARGARVTAAQLFAIEGGASGEKVLEIQRANKAKKDAEQAEKNARTEAAAAKRAAALAKAASSALDLLQRISAHGSRVVDNFTIKDIKDILQYSEPEAAAPKGLKEELKARLLKLPTVVQALKAHEVASAAAASVEVAPTRALVTGCPPMPAAPPPQPPPEAAEPPSIEKERPVASISGEGSSVDSAQVGIESPAGPGA